MLTRRRVAGALLALILPAVTALTAVTAASAAPTPATPPGCTTNDPDQDCLHAPSPDLGPVAAPTYTTSYDLKTQTRTVDLNVVVTPPYHACPLTPGIPFDYLPCTQPSVTVNPRIYAPGSDTPLAFAAVPVDGSACVFTCDAQFKITAPYHGPATFIVKYSMGEVLRNEGNQLFISTVETTITLPSDPFIGALHATAAKVVLHGKLKSQVLQLAGKGGIPPSGVGGVLAIITNTGAATVQGGDYIYGGIGTLEVIPGTTLHIKKVDPGTLTVTTVGWWSTRPSDSGTMLHVTDKSHHLPLKGTVSLTHYLVPADATGALINIITPKGASRIGGVLVGKSEYEQFVLVPLKAGAKVAIKAATGSTIMVRGYLAPVRTVDSGLTLVTFTHPGNLPGALQIG